MDGKCRNRGIVAAVAVIAVAVSVLFMPEPAALGRSLSPASAGRAAPTVIGSVTKTASVDHFSSAGQLIQYTVTVVNSGNAPAMTPVTVTDSRADATGNAPTCTIAEIPAYGASGSCVLDYYVTAADVAAGSITDTATASYGSHGDLQQVTSNPVTVDQQDGAAIGLTTQASSPTFSAADDEITYSYTVANDGDQPVNQLSVADTIGDADLSVTCSTGQLDVATDNVASCTASYQVTAADVTAGSITNAAEATATVPATGDQVSDTDSTTIHLAGGPAVGLATAAQPQSFSTAGQPITYTYTVANDGNSGLSDVSVSDTVSGQPVPVSCDGDSLDTGAQPVECQATYDVTQADLNSGSITNDATVTATGTANGQPVQVSQSASDTILRDDQPDIAVASTASVDSFSQAGTEITYSSDVTNTGNTPLSGIGVSGSLGGSADCGGVTTLAPGASARCLATSRTTAADVAAGHLTSTVTARGRTAAGREVTGTSTLRIPAVHAPEVSILKTASPGAFSRAGDRVAYFYQVTNAGNVPLAGVTVNDSRLRGLSCPLTALAAGEHMVCAAAHVITAADLARGSVANAARVRALAPGGRELTRSTMAIVPSSPIPARSGSFLREVPVTG